MYSTRVTGCVTSPKAIADSSKIEAGGSDFWNFCEPYMIFQGQAFYNDFKDGMTFDTVGTEVKSIVPFENEKQGSPVVVRILSDGVSPIGPTRGDITWLYDLKCHI